MIEEIKITTDMIGSKTVVIIEDITAPAPLKYKATASNGLAASNEPAYIPNATIAIPKTISQISLPPKISLK